MPGVGGLSGLGSKTGAVGGLQLQQCVLVCCQTQQIKFSELTLDFLRMMRVLEREPIGVSQEALMQQRIQQKQEQQQQEDDDKKQQQRKSSTTNGGRAALKGEKSSFFVFEIF